MNKEEAKKISQMYDILEYYEVILNDKGCPFMDILEHLMTRDEVLRDRIKQVCESRKTEILAYFASLKIDKEV